MSTEEGLLAQEAQGALADYEARSAKPQRPVRLAKKRRGATPILYMLSPQKYMSPFDTNMAIDSGYKVILPYANVTLGDVHMLVQDAIFSRPPEKCPRTGLFIGGKDIGLALEMMAAAKAAMVPPFEVSVFADPGGSFTTAASLVACVERVLKRQFQRELEDVRIAVFGAAGVVGFASATLAALEGAKVQIVAHESIEPLQSLAAIAQERFGADLEPIGGQTEAAKARIVRDADVIFCTAAAGVRVISRKQIARATRLLVAADVNAVAPTGIEGMEAHMNGAPLPASSAVGVGPLTIGDIKYKTQAGLFRRMLSTNKPLNLDFRDAFAFARALTSDRPKVRKLSLS
jgi:methylene-tetrahydromethanopterin dehydrogenase